jgi:hypothetical protein
LRFDPFYCASLLFIALSGIHAADQLATRVGVFLKPAGEDEPHLAVGRAAGGEVERQVAAQGLMPLPIHPIENKVNKKLRIGRLGPYLARKQLRIRNNHGGRLLVEQCRQFSQKDVSGVHDDGPDALEMALRTGIEIQGGQVRDDGLGDKLGSM